MVRDYSVPLRNSLGDIIYQEGGLATGGVSVPYDITCGKFQGTTGSWPAFDMMSDDYSPNNKVDIETNCYGGRNRCRKLCEMNWDPTHLTGGLTHDANLLGLITKPTFLPTYDSDEVYNNGNPFWDANIISDDTEGRAIDSMDRANCEIYALERLSLVFFQEVSDGALPANCIQDNNVIKWNTNSGSTIKCNAVTDVVCIGRLMGIRTTFEQVDTDALNDLSVSVRNCEYYARINGLEFTTVSNADEIKGCYRVTGTTTNTVHYNAIGEDAKCDTWFRLCVQFTSDRITDLNEILEISLTGFELPHSSYDGKLKNIFSTVIKSHSFNDRDYPYRLMPFVTGKAGLYTNIPVYAFNPLNLHPCCYGGK